MNDDLEARYLAYLAVLNERRLDDLVHFVHERLTYNDEEITGRGYRDMIAADIAAVPDLVFDPHLVVVSGDRVACRLVSGARPGTRSSGSRRTASRSPSRSTSSTGSTRAASPR